MCAASVETSETIYAISTGVGRSAIAIVRVSGPRCSSILSRLCPGIAFPNRVATHTAIRDGNGEILDYGLVINFCGPRSFTGEDIIEFQVTGSRAVLSGLLRTLASLPGTRPAEPGEFARRAFVNGKRDLAEIEGLASLVEAETAAQLRHAMKMASGEVSRQCEQIRGQLLRSMSLVELLLDFSDVEDAADLTLEQVTSSLADTLNSMNSLVAHDDTEARLRDGMTIVIAGPPNAGKSTLLNALARRDVAIVSEIPGTTRDPLEVNTEVAGFPVTFVDTAGLRDTIDPVEAEGIARARKRSASADLTLWLRSSSDLLDGTPAPTGPLLLVTTKIDLAPSAPPTEGIAISALTGEGISILVGEIAEVARNHFSGTGSVILGTQRQRAAAREAAAALRRVLQTPELSIEIVAEELRLAAAAMGRITGRIDVEEVLGDIFTRLCVGK